MKYTSPAYLSSRQTSGTDILLRRKFVLNSSPFLGLEFVTGPQGPLKRRGPGQIPRPAPLIRAGRGVFLSIPRPFPRPGPRPIHAPDGPPSKMGGKKRGPVLGVTESGPRTGVKRGRGEKCSPPAPCNVWAWQVKARPSPPRNEHYLGPLRHHECNTRVLYSSTSQGMARSPKRFNILTPASFLPIADRPST